MKIKIDPVKALSIAVTTLTVVGNLLSVKVDANNRKAMKAELKNELLEEISGKKG